MAPSLPDLSCVRLEFDGPVLVATIDRPGSELNAVNEDLHADLAALFRWLRSSPPARAVVLAGSKQAFSAGGDFDWFPSLRSLAAADHVARDGKQLIWDLLDVDVPVVAAVNGPAIGLGASVALLCDAVVMAESATIADPHVRVGLVAGDGGTAIWPLVLGPALAKRYLLTGDPVTADQALFLGLATHVVPDGEARDAALAFAHRLAAGAPLALQGTKRAVNALVKNALNSAFDVATAWEVSTFLSSDHVEAMDAIRERRRPQFEGK